MCIADTNYTCRAANIIGVKEDSRIGVIQALWTYIKQNNLQDKQDRRRVRADAPLRAVCRFMLRKVIQVALTTVCADIQRRSGVLPAATRDRESVPRAARTYHPTLYIESDGRAPVEASGMGCRGQGR